MSGDSVVSLLPRQLDKLLEPVFTQKEIFERALRALLHKFEFKERFIEHVVDDLVEAFMNEDETPLWHQPWFKPSGE